MKAHYTAPTLPTDEHRRDRHGLPAREGDAVLRNRAGRTDTEDGPKGFGAHSDQERILESELYRFVRLNWDIVTQLAAAFESGRRARTDRFFSYGIRSGNRTMKPSRFGMRTFGSVCAFITSVGPMILLSDRMYAVSA